MGLTYELLVVSTTDEGLTVMGLGGGGEAAVVMFFSLTGCSLVPWNTSDHDSSMPTDRKHTQI